MRVIKSIKIVNKGLKGHESYGIIVKSIHGGLIQDNYFTISIGHKHYYAYNPNYQDFVRLKFSN